MYRIVIVFCLLVAIGCQRPQPSRNPLLPVGARGKIIEVKPCLLILDENAHGREFFADRETTVHVRLNVYEKKPYRWEYTPDPANDGIVDIMPKSRRIEKRPDWVEGDPGLQIFSFKIR